MICLGKSYWNANKDDIENKENADNNILRPKNPQKPLLKPLQLLKKNSDAPTLCSSEPEVDDFAETLKRTYSQKIANDYSSDILVYLKQVDPQLNNFLAHHSISKSLRAKMIDWMVEVLSSYKMSEDTFFRSVNFMDQYLKHEERVQETKDIHLIGVASMFSAMKYEEIHPLRLSLITEKIGRKKFSREEIINKESRMMEVLGFCLNSSTVFDLVKLIDHEIKVALKPSLREYLHKILIYLSKMCTFDHHLIACDKTLLATAVYFIGLKTLEQVARDLVPEQLLPSIAMLTNTGEDNILEMGRAVLELAKTFSKMYPNLNNLKKFNRFEYREE